MNDIELCAQFCKVSSNRASKYLIPTVPEGRDSQHFSKNNAMERTFERSIIFSKKWR